MSKLGREVSELVEFVKPGTTIRAIINTKVTDLSKRENIDDAFYIIDIGKVVSQFNRWQKLIPRIQPFYAMKCNPDPVILRVLAHLGAGFDCASKNEIAKIVNLGIPRANIVYSHPCKQQSHLSFAHQNDVSVMTFDTKEELEKIKRTYPRAKLMIRFATDDASAMCKLDGKFGCQLTEVEDVLQRAKELALNVVGVCFHVGSYCLDPDNFATAIRSCRHVLDIASAVGYKLEILNIGGGFPGGFRYPGIPPFEKFAVAINTAVEEHFPLNLYSTLRIISEPGRYFAGDCATLVMNVIGRKRTITKSADSGCSDTQEFKYYLNNGFHGSLYYPIFRQVQITLPSLKERKPDAPTFTCSVWGQTCNGEDYIIKECQLPELEIGEWVFLEAVGAYSIVLETSFNGFNNPECYYVAPDHLQ